jgi:hypothetical protein
MNTLNDCNEEDDLFPARKQNTAFKKVSARFIEEFIQKPCI